MKTILKFALAMLFIPALVGCGLWQADGEDAERGCQDSIARLDQSLLEQQSVDSVAAVEKGMRDEAMERKFREDSAARAEMIPLFAVVKNDGDDAAVSYIPKGVSACHIQNAVYLCCKVVDGRSARLVCCVDYNGSDWIDPNAAVFTIDNETFQVEPDSSGVETNVNSNLSCSEWFSTTAFPGNFIDKLADAKAVSVKITGDKGSRIIIINHDQLRGMQNVICFYKLFGN